MAANILKFKMPLVVLMFFMFSASFAFSADVFYNPQGGGEPNSCGEVSNEIPTISSSGGFNEVNASRLRCITDIDGLKLTLHKAGICTSAPDISDPSTDWLSKCVFIVDDVTGIEVSVTATSLSSISSDKINLSGLIEATYTHAVIMVGNSLQTKTNANFSENFRGSDGEGPFCYSINAPDPGNNPSAYSDLAVKCVANEAAMNSQGDHGFSSKEFNSFRNGSNFLNSKTATNGDLVYVFSDMETIATVANDGSSDATRVVGVMEMATPAVISPSSTNFNAGFQLSDQGQIRLSSAGVCNSASLAGATACVTSMRNYGVGFKVTVN